MSAPYAKYTIVGTGAGVTSSNSRVVKHSMSAARMFGATFNQYQFNEVLLSANPSHQWFWHVDTHALDDSAFQGARIITEITYDVDFSDRVELTLDMRQQRRQQLQEFRKLYLAAKLKGKTLELSNLVGVDHKTDTLQVSVTPPEVKAESKGESLVLQADEKEPGTLARETVWPDDYIRVESKSNAVSSGVVTQKQLKLDFGQLSKQSQTPTGRRNATS